MECSVNEFILQCYLDDDSICDELIDFHKKSDRKIEGQCFKNNIPILDLEYKKSTDTILVEDNNLWKNYTTKLQNICNIYIDKFVYCNQYSAWTIKEPINIQHYKPHEGYYQWHTERSSSQSPYSSRHLVFMTYLNDVFDGGETEFYYQKIKIQPRKGLTLIWPADWTHTHKGITSPTQEKYIITGWYNFY